MKQVAAAIALIAAIALLAVPLCSEDSGANPAVIIYDMDLTEDETYEDGTEVTVSAGATINLNDYTLTIGQNSKITFEGAATVTCGSGSIVVGSGTSFVMFGTAIAGFDTDVTYTFEGTATFSGVSSEDSPAIEFGDGESVTASWNSGLELTFTDFKMYQAASGTDISRIFGFSDMHFESTVYDGDDVVSTRTVDAVPEDADKTVTLSIHSNLNVDAVICEFTTVEVSDHYTESDATNTMICEGFGPAQAGFTASDRMLHAEIYKIDTAVIEKAVGGEVSTTSTFTKLEVYIYVSIDELLELLASGITGDSPDWLQELQIQADSAILVDEENGIEKELTELSLAIVASSDDYLTAKATDGDKDITLTATKVVFNSYSVTRDFVISVDATIEETTLVVEESGTEVQNLTVSGIDLQFTSLDVKNLHILYARTGTLALEHILDNSKDFTVQADSLVSDSDGDGTTDLGMSQLGLDLRKNAQGMYTMTVSFDGLDTYVDVNGSTAIIHVDTSNVYMEVAGSLAEVLDSLLYYSHYTADAHAEIQISNAGFSIDYSLYNGTVSVSTVKSGDTSPAGATATVSLDHSVYQGNTVVSGVLSAIGYTFTAELHTSYEDPDGTLDVVLCSRDATGAFSLEFGEGINYSANFSIPWSFDFNYYGIEFQVDAGSSALSLTHGHLTVADYDTTQSGFLALPAYLMKSDFAMDMRVTFDMSSLLIYQEDRSKLLHSRTNVEMDIKKIGVNLAREDTLKIAIDQFYVGFTDTDGSSVEHSLNHLDIAKDLSGKEKSKTLLEDIMAWILVPCCIVLFALLLYIAYLRGSRPDLFKFNEHTEGEAEGEAVGEPADEPAETDAVQDSDGDGNGGN